MRRIVHRRPIGWAFIVVIVISAAQGVVLVAAGGQSSSYQGGWLEGRIQVVAISVLAVVGIANTALFAALCKMMSKVLGGQGSYGRLFAGAAFAYMPIALSVPVSFVALSVGLLTGPLFFLLGIGALAWTTVLLVMAVRESSGFSTVRATSVTLFSIAAVAAINCAVYLIVWLTFIGLLYLSGWES